MFKFAYYTLQSLVNDNFSVVTLSTIILQYTLTLCIVYTLDYQRNHVQEKKKKCFYIHIYYNTSDYKYKHLIYIKYIIMHESV